MTEHLTAEEYRALGQANRRIQNRPEEQLHRDTAKLLRAIVPPEVFWWHTPNQRGTRKEWENKLLKALGVKAGFPDFGFVYEGRATFIELKPPEYRNRKNGGRSDNQVKCHADLEAAGCQVATCYTVEEVEGTLRAWLPLKGRVAA